jgi:hypothetical protein
MMFIDSLDGCCNGDRNTWNTFPVSLNQTRAKGSLLEKYLTANKKEPLTLCGDGGELLMTMNMMRSKNQSSQSQVHVMVILGTENLVVKSQFK